MQGSYAVLYEHRRNHPVLDVQAGATAASEKGSEMKIPDVADFQVWFKKNFGEYVFDCGLSLIEVESRIKEAAELLGNLKDLREKMIVAPLMEKAAQAAWVWVHYQARRQKEAKTK